MRASVAVLASGGVRFGEALSMRYGWVHFKESDGVAYIEIQMKAAPGQKTGPRAVVIDDVWAAKVLRAWVQEQYPALAVDRGLRGVAREDTLFPAPATTGALTPLPGTTARKYLAAAVRRAGVTKKLPPHLFRYGVATRLAAAGVGEGLMRKAMGWRPGSTMPDFYYNGQTSDIVKAKDAIRAKAQEQVVTWAKVKAETDENRLRQMLDEVKAFAEKLDRQRNEAENAAAEAMTDKDIEETQEFTEARAARIAPNIFPRKKVKP